ncbi:MAG: hypothetical protein ABL864_04125 [Terricaulis sp.]
MTVPPRPPLEKILQRDNISKYLQEMTQNDAKPVLSKNGAQDKKKSIPDDASELAYSFFTPARINLAPSKK